jgi:hypothetical protein
MAEGFTASGLIFNREESYRLIHEAEDYLLCLISPIKGLEIVLHVREDLD